MYMLYENVIKIVRSDHRRYTAYTDETLKQSASLVAAKGKAEGLQGFEKTK